MKTLIAIPCMDMVHTQFASSLLGLRLSGEVQFSFLSSSLVYDSRNQLLKKAVDEDFDRVLWLDSDMTFEPDLFERMSKHMDEGLDFVCALYVTRKSPFKPCMIKNIGLDVEGDKATPKAETYFDYKKNSLFEIEACGFAGVMTSAKLLKSVGKKYGVAFSPLLGFGEDYSFCLRAKKEGFKLYCDSSIKMGHIGLMTFTEDILEGTQCIK